jgi:uncharacterized iron-regulated membrane protein
MKTLLWLHRWAGLIAGIAIFVIAVTGCILTFENDIDRRLNRELMLVTPGDSTVPLKDAVDAVRAAYPNEFPQSISLPQAPNHSLLISLKSGKMAAVDPYTGRVLGIRDRFDGIARDIHLMHTRFMAGKTGEHLVGAFTIMTLLMAVSGLVLWWPRKIVGVKNSKSWRRVNFDVHNILGFYSAAVLVVTCASGIIIAYEDVTDPLVLKLNTKPASKPAQVSSTPIEGAAPISPDEAVRVAKEAMPGIRVANVNVPSPGKAVYRLSVKYPEDRTPAGRSRIALDQYNGAVLDLISTRNQELGTQILNLKRSLHTGDVFGAPSLAIVFLTSLMLAGQVVTGFLIWWKPGKFAVATNGGRTSPATATPAAV